MVKLGLDKPLVEAVQKRFVSISCAPYILYDKFDSSTLLTLLCNVYRAKSGAAEKNGSPKSAVPSSNTKSPKPIKMLCDNVNNVCDNVYFIHDAFDFNL